MKKSLIITHIANIDYPLWRAWLEKYHSWFDEIIICWDLSFRFPIFSSFIQGSLSHLPNIKFLDPVERDLGTEDWRNKATNEMLKHATGDWICSIEQDWFCRDWSEFFESAERSMATFDMFGWWNPTNFPYIHPAFWFIKRELLEKTSKDFAPHPEINGADHFSMITQDVIELGTKIDKYGGEVFPETLCFHLGGVNTNYLGFLNNPKTELHRRDIFYIYNYWSMQVQIEQSPYFMEIMKKVDGYLKYFYKTNKISIEDPQKNEWAKFFK